MPNFTKSVFAVHPSLGVKSVADLVLYAGKNLKAISRLNPPTVITNPLILLLLSLGKT